MKRIAILFCTVILLVGCSLFNGEQNEENDKPSENEDQENEKEEKNDNHDELTEGNMNEETSSDHEDALDNADSEVQITGEVTIDEDEVTIDGESNLLPGTFLQSSGTTVHDMASSTFIDKAEVEEDGSFSFSFSGISASTFVELQLNPKTDEAKKLYGEDLEKVEGPQVYLTDTHDEYRVMADFFVDVNKEMPYTIPIEVPHWNEEPEDYGEPDVWMEADYDTDHDYIYFTGESNLMEGSQIGGNLRYESDQIEAFSFDHTRINPDGTFELKVPYHTLKKDMYMPIRYKPDSNSWDDVVDIYGENGENLKGDLTVQDEDNTELEFIVELDTPDYEPPEDVGLTVDDDEVKIQMPDDLLFDFDESTLKDDSKEIMESVLTDLDKLEDGTEVEINGHTDNEGEKEYNLTLSEERADAVWDYLKEHGDMDRFDVEVEGYGAEKPIFSNEDSDGRTRNRRVEIVINPAS